MKEPSSDDTEAVGDEGETSQKPQPAVAAAEAAGKTQDQDEAEDDNDDDPGPSEHDLVIRDGFPALRIPGSKTYKPMLQGDEPLPRYPFWTSPNAIHFHPDHLETLRQDCETVFTARDKPDGAAYSAGQTFFLPCNRTPRCALEALAMMIFRKHTEHLEPGTFDPATSGANWWTLVMDENKNKPTNATAHGEDKPEDEEEDDEDEVGLHFDADYELEEQTTNILLHPRVGTVTYLSDYGAPTVVFNLKSPAMDDLERKALEKNIDKAWLSHPELGKHTAFDGRLLHGAPALYFPSRVGHNNNQKDTSGTEPDAKRQKLDQKRYTLLVNIWLNHWVMDAALLDDEVCSRLKTPWETESGNLKGDDSYAPPFSWNKDADLTRPSLAGKTVKLAPSKINPAGEDEIALCNHNVTVKYNPLMEECHSASSLGPSVELELEEGAISLHVGEVLQADEDGE